jgi:hypothetical protein
MKNIRFISTLFAIGLALFASGTQAQTTKPLPKPTPSEIKVLPFCGTKMNAKIDPKTREVFDELKITKSSRIHIHGAKKYDTGRLNGEVVWHMGKIALFPPGDRTGKFVVKARAQERSRYFVSIELEDKLETKELTLKRDQVYDWQVKSENGNTTFKITEGQAVVAAITVPTAQVKGVGFAATARFTGNEADMDVSFD